MPGTGAADLVGYRIDVSQELTERTPAQDSAVPALSVVLPAFNEEEALPTVVADIRRWVPDAEIIVVDDGSKDATAQIAHDLDCVLVRHDHNRGKGNYKKFCSREKFTPFSRREFI